MDVFDLYAKIGLDKSEYEAGLKDAKGSMSSLASSVGNGLKTVAKVGAAAVTAAAAGVAALTKMGVEGYAEYEQLVGGVETLFGLGGQSLEEYAKSMGKTADEAWSQFSKATTGQRIVLNNAEKAYKTAGMSANEYMETVTSFSASLIQSLDGDTAKAAKVADVAITDMSDNANKMGTSIEMIQNAYNGFAKQNYTMLDNLKLGYGGTKEEMERLIADANKVKEANGEMADLSIDSFADVTEAIHIIQSEMGITGTTAREAATTIEGSLSMMKGAWQNLVVALADDDPEVYIEGLVDTFVETVATVAQNLLPRLKQTLAGIGQLITGIAPIIAEALPMLIEAVLPSLLSAGVSLVSAIISGLITAAPALYEAIMTALYTTLTSVFGMSEEEASGFVANLDGLFQSAFTAIETIFNALYQLVSTIFGSIGDVANDLGITWDDVFAGIQTAVEFCGNTIAVAAEFIGNALKWLVNEAQTDGTFINRVFDTIKATVDFLWTACVVAFEAISAAFSWVAEQMNTDGTLINTIWENIKICISSAIDFIKGVIDFFIAVLKGDWDAAWEAVKNIAKSAWDAICAVFDSAWEIIKSIFSVVAGWFDKNVIQPVKNIFTGMWDGLKNGAKNAWNGITSVFSNVTNWFKDKFSAAWQAVKNVFSTGGKVFDGIKDGIVSVFKTVVNAIIGGINKVISVPFNAINGILKTIKNIEIVGIRPFDWVQTFTVPQIPKLSTGLNFVPYDEYPAFLHRGEAVLTAAQARAWRNGQGGTALTGDNGQIVSVLISILNAITGGNEELLQAMLSGSTIVLNEREFARAVRTYA